MLWYLILWLVTASLCSDSDTDTDTDDDDDDAKVNLHFSASEEGSAGDEEIDSLPQLAEVDDAQHRGWKWYDDTSTSEGQSSAFKSEASSSLSSVSSSESKSSSASSQESSAREIRKRVYRTCTPCPQDMLRSFRNKGIKWICAGYQRARRTFKSTCMMRYRNCEDGTMFVKLYDRRCKNDSYHGKHFFYTYRT